MKISLTKENAAQIEADALVVGVHADQAPVGAAADIDTATGGVISRLLESKEITCKKEELATLLAPAGVNAPVVIVVGLGEREKLDRGTAFRAAGAAAKQLAGKQRSRIAMLLEAEASGHWPAELVESGVCGAVVGCHGQDLYRAEKKRTPFDEIVWGSEQADAIESGRLLGESVNLTRRLVNEPPSDMNPEAFADTASVVAGQCGLEVEVWDKAKLQAENCGSLLAVARGSAREPRLVILRHNGGKKGDAPLALVGKGVTFDSGGLSLKPSDSMKTMKCDMAGAATVFGAMQAIAKLNLPINVIGLMGLVENMVSGDSYKLGDVLRARSGKTIEILNTDAEGRLVLADVLNVAIERGAAKIIDLATLTGACVVALGMDVAGLMTNDSAWCDTVRAAADTCGEEVWQLPMFDFYGEQIKSEVADIKNIGDGRWGGAITAAKFLEEFVEGKPWVHMDIAGPAFVEKSKSWIDGGGSGAFVRTLVEVARNWIS